MDNIIDLNSFRKEKGSDKFERLLKTYENVDHMFTDFSVVVLHDLIDVVRQLDLNIEDNPEAMKNVLICIESLKSLLHTLNGTKTPFSDIVADVLNTDDIDVNELLENFLNYDLDN